MSKIFYDHLVVFEKVDVVIKESTNTTEEKEELWKVVDELVHNHVLTSILEKLSDEHHDDFLEKYHTHPYDESLIDYINDKVEGNIEEVIQNGLELLEEEILREIEEIK
jgi:hypothetical protein